MAKILIFGDSIVYGHNDSSGGWVGRLQEVLNQRSYEDDQFDLTPYNLGVSGDTSNDLLKRFESEVRARKKDEDLIIVFAVGINDAMLVHATGINQVKPQQFEENLHKLIQRARKHTSHVVFLGLTPVEQLRVDPIPWHPEGSYRDSDMEKFDRIVRTVCRTKDIHFIDVRNVFLEQDDYKKLLADGVHPNTKGHEVIFDVVYEYLEKSGLLDKFGKIDDI